MSNKNRLFRVTSLLLVLCFVSTVMISGTFAKYTSEFAGSDTALVAKWEITPTTLSGVTGASEKVLGTDSLDLFAHAYDDNILSTAGGQKIIAPGVGGEFTLNVANTGDVAAKIEFTFAETQPTGGTLPIVYAYKVGEGDLSDYGTLAALKTGLDGAMTNVGEQNGEVEVLVKWEWPFERGAGAELTDNDEDDTDLGVASAVAAAVPVTGERTKYILNVTATATQIEPE